MFYNYDIIIIWTKEVQKVMVKGKNGYKNYCPLPNKCNIISVVSKIKKFLIEKELDLNANSNSTSSMNTNKK